MSAETKPRTLADELDIKAVSHPSLAAAMAEAFAEISAATKSAENPAFKQGGKVSKYADLTAIIEAIKPPLIAHGLFFTQRCQPAEDGVSVETVLHHAGGESLSLGTLYLPANKRDPQGFGSALTYARRYGLQTAFGVPVEDDDGNAGTKSVGNGKSKYVSEEQFAELEALRAKANVSAEQFCEAYKIDAIAALPVDLFARAKASLQRAAQKEPANA